MLEVLFTSLIGKQMKMLYGPAAVMGRNYEMPLSFLEGKEHNFDDPKSEDLPFNETLETLRAMEGVQRHS